MSGHGDIRASRAGRFFLWVTRTPGAMLVAGVLGIVLCLSFLPGLHKDTSAEAFIPDDHPALVNRDRAEDTFGLRDPMVVAVVNDGPAGIFNPHSLRLVDRLTRDIRQIPGIDPDRVSSLATENDIRGTGEGMAVEPFLDPLPETPEQARQVARAVEEFPLLRGSLVARDGSATLIVAELLEPERATEIYQALETLADDAPTQAGESIHVAGEGAVRGFLSTYIDRDAGRLNPLSALIITLVLFVAFRSLRGVVLPNLVVIATVGSALGLMAAAGVDFYVITNSLPVILIGIAVADSIHILSQYYYEHSRAPDSSARLLVVRTMVAMWRPVTLTTVTTMAGFIGLAAASTNMPPMVAYGIFAAIGVAVAWLYSLLLVPAALVMLKPRPSRAYRPRADSEPDTDAGRDLFTRVMTRLGALVDRRAGAIAAVAGVIVLVGIAGLTRLEMNYNRIDNFRSSEPIHRADRAINSRFDGSHYLDVVVETPVAEDLLRPDNLQRIQALQAYMEQQPLIQGTTSVVDYLKQMNRALNEGDPGAYALPDSVPMTAQFFLLYNASGDPTDFEHLVTRDYRMAHVRGRLRTGEYGQVAPVVDRLESYLREEFNSPGIQGSVTGNVHLTYYWLKPLAQNHFLGVALALLLIGGVSAFWFRSPRAGALAALPVAFAVLAVYAIMGFAGIWLSVGTSMFAAIAIGLGVDFAIHVIARLRALLAEQPMAIGEAITHLYATTGRALLFNFLALAMGFGVLLFSYVPPLNDLGLLVACAVTTAFIASMTFLPALVRVFGPRLLGLPAAHESLDEKELGYAD